MGGGGTLSKGREGNYEEDEGWKHIGPNGNDFLTSLFNTILGSERGTSFEEQR